MTFSTLKKIINDSIVELINRDSYLLEHDVNERSISHKLAIYINNGMMNQSKNKWDVDAEYNRNMEDPKRLKCLESNNIITYPDIIIHVRGKNNDKRIKNNNLLIIEIKKNEYSIDDFKKICCFIKSKPYYYKYGLIINLNYKKGEPELFFLERQNIDGKIKVQIMEQEKDKVLERFGLSPAAFDSMTIEELAEIDIKDEE